MNTDKSDDEEVSDNEIVDDAVIVDDFTDDLSANNVLQSVSVEHKNQTQAEEIKEHKSKQSKQFAEVSQDGDVIHLKRKPQNADGMSKR